MSPGHKSTNAPANQRICDAKYATRIDSGQRLEQNVSRGPSFFGNEIRNPVAKTKQASGDSHP